jgi:TRAP-type C4-dicarboxylate transport system permease small subunit
VGLGQWADRLVRAVAYAGLILYPALVACTVWEVVARYVFHAPTIWAFDITFMLHGSLFVLTGAYALQTRSHIRIDVLSTRLPARVQHAANLAAYAALWPTPPSGGPTRPS